MGLEFAQRQYYSCHSHVAQKKHEMRFPLLLFVLLASTVSQADDDLFEPGDQLQLLTNLHPHPTKNVLTTMNLQQEGLLKACARVEVKKLRRNTSTFIHDGEEYKMEFDGHTRKAGITFDEALATNLGESCDQAKMLTLSQKDTDGVKRGIARVGMIKDGVYFAMGRPPYHANPSLTSNRWDYWRGSRRRAVEFNRDGIVVRVR